MNGKLILAAVAGLMAAGLASTVEAAELLPVIPQPRSWTPSGARPFKVTEGLRRGRDFSGVRFERDATKAADDESYTIEVASAAIRVRAGGKLGFSRAKATLMQLAAAGATISSGRIEDAPAYRMRGFMLDVARRPYSLRFLRALAHELAYYKMNVFHVHLNDDGAGPFLPKDGYSRFRLESERHPGLAAEDLHYTKAEFRAFVKECAAIGVTVIPEIDSPAHCGAFGRYLRKRGGKFDIATDYTNAVGFVTSLFDEYLGGDDPVFAGPYVHVGMDEYGAANADVFRAYGEVLRGIVRRYGKKPCMWGANEHPTKAPGQVLVDIWNWAPKGYDPLVMIENGYDTLCTHDNFLYIVPAAGYYHDYLDLDFLFDKWEPTMFSSRQATTRDNPRLFGGKFAVWNDISCNGITEDDTFDRVFPALQVLAQKMWSGRVEGQAFADFQKLADATGEWPGLNLRDRLTGPNGKPAPKDKAVGWSQGGGYSVSFEIRPSAAPKADSVIFDDGFAQVKLSQGESGKVGFSCGGYSHTFDFAAPVGKWTRLEFRGDCNGVRLFADGVCRGSTKGCVKVHDNWCNRKEKRCFRRIRTMHFPLVKRPFDGRIRSLAVRTGREVATGEFDGAAADVSARICAEGVDVAIVRNVKKDAAEGLVKACGMAGRYGEWKFFPGEGGAGTVLMMHNFGACPLTADERKDIERRVQADQETVCECEGAYRWHLQGICTDGPHLYWTFSDRLVKTDLEGKRLACVSSPMHSGDLCYHAGLVYVAVNLGKFNGAGPADSWVYVYKASDLSFVRKHPVPEVEYGAGGMTAKDDRFYVVGGLPKGCPTNYVYEYASDFRFVKRHDLATGWLNLGIQTVSYENGKFYFGNYGGSGKPANTFACGADLKGPFEFYLPASDYGILTVKGRLCSGEHLKKTDPETGKQACGGRLVPFAAIRLKRDPKTGRWAK